MQKLPLQALAAFDAVVRNGGVRAAARALGIAHSAVSRRIDELERAIGKPLLEPRAHPGAPMRLTARGQDLAGVVEASFAQLRAALDVRSRQVASPEVLVSTTDSFAARWLLPRLVDFRQRHPRIAVSVSVRGALVDVQRDPVDVALRMGNGPWPHARPWMDDALVPVVSPVLLRGRLPWPLKRLRELPLLHDQDPNATWGRWRDELGPADLDVQRGQSLPASHLLIEAAAQGLGVALVRRRLAQRELDAGTLVMPFGRYAIPLPQAYWTVVRPTSARRPPVRSFLQWLDQQGA
ncbi:LysR substrate-binding domain-containing protein [Pseudoxanthomonas dokdonensis]|uniref:HTH lysR-type domain-containing protein n=1 Tax=Pseudoxanthomonas dokdonensis TaxID=344882 RepID=A0A0R0CNE2_9GAMM|nr:LysR substrate-binding domain-containing protein [Pseudoxanthomonas dokdonensis]KRG71533.1 hypothetical protein ABB29_01805 [Pseudoxanthomonas dokdonensis]